MTDEPDSFAHTAAAGRSTGRPLVITQGDPEGVGPELILRALAAGRLQARDRIVADPAVFSRLCAALPELAALRDPLTPMLVGPVARTPTEGELGQFAALAHGVDLVQASPGTGLVTAPIDKARACAEGLRHPGHTEYLAERAGVEDFAMLMAGSSIKVALATIHIPLAQVPRELTRVGVGRVVRLLASALRRDFAIARPRIGVLGLNPHAGEQGLLGCEEREIIEPALRDCREWARIEGLPHTFVGPLPADTAFHRHVHGDFDGLVAMYHDQGLGPFKLQHFSDGVNVTLGLPYVRTSPDHGTARDIAGRGVADPSSFFAAIDLARGQGHDDACD